MGGSENAFNELIEQFIKYLQSSPSNEKNDNIIDNIFPLMRTERWEFLKDVFSIDKVYLIGELKDIYKVYCVDQKSKVALYFNLKGNSDLNDISIINEKDIYIGNLTRQTSVNEAIQLLETCPYNTPIKPENSIFTELLEFLNRNK